jgi:hypothetical protein
MDNVSRPRVPSRIWNEIEGLIETEYETFDRKNGRVDTIDRAEKILEAVEEGVKHL